MSKIGYLKAVMNGNKEELHGEVATLQMQLKIKLIPNTGKMNENAPDYIITAAGYSGFDIPIGGAWKKTKSKIGDIEFEFLSITIDDPSLPNSLNVAAFKNSKRTGLRNKKRSKSFIRRKKIPVLVQPAGARGYQFIFDTGIDRETWWLADNNKSDRWNIRTSVKSLSLALYGYRGVKANILGFLEDMGARGVNKDFSLLERVSRFDYCFDFISNDFSINPKCISAHSNTKRQFIGAQELITKNKDIEYVRIGKMPNRQIVFYDKKKEITQKRKEYWFNLWGIDKEKLNNKKVWRVEIRAGKEELNTWNLKRFSDFEEKSGDILSDIANSIRYVKPNYKDKNKGRWKNKEFWDLVLNELKTNLFEFSSNAERNKLISIFKSEKEQEYLSIITNLIAPYMALRDYSYDDLALGLSAIERHIALEYRDFPEIYENKIKEAKDRFVFLD